MSAQRELAFPPNAPTPATLNHRVLALLSNGEWWTPWRIQGALRDGGTMASDSAITARLRDLRKPRYGSHAILKRRREGSNAYEYRLGD